MSEAKTPRRRRRHRDAINAPARDKAAHLVAYRVKPGQVLNPLGGNAPGSKRELYRESRRLALDASPHAMRRAIELIDSADERVASINVKTVLDAAGVRPIDRPEFEEDGAERFAPERLTPRQLAQLEAAARLYLRALVPESAVSATDAQGEPIRGEILPPEGETRS